MADQVSGRSWWIWSSSESRLSVRIEVDETQCVGHGRCYSLAPDLFDADEQGHSVVLQQVVPAEREEDARITADACPERAISLAE